MVTSASTPSPSSERSCGRPGSTSPGSHHAHALHSPYWWLRCLVGPQRDDHKWVARYKRFLEWDIIEQPRSTRIADRLLSPVLGKSVVLYARKPAVPAHDRDDAGARGSRRMMSCLPQIPGVLTADEIRVDR